MAGEKKEKDLFFQVEGVKYEDVTEVCSKQSSPKKSLQCISIHSKNNIDDPLGTEVLVNNKTLALFKYRGIVYAMDSKCPHMGGPLHLGDIEELGEAKVPCIVCPWHHWKYDIDTGDVKCPMHQNVKVVVYPVKVMHDGLLFVGFDSISPDYFNCAEDF